MASLFLHSFMPVIISENISCRSVKFFFLFWWALFVLLLFHFFHLNTLPVSLLLFVCLFYILSVDVVLDT